MARDGGLHVWTSFVTRDHAKRAHVYRVKPHHLLEPSALIGSIWDRPQANGPVGSLPDTSPQVRQLLVAAPRGGLPFSPKETLG